LKEYPSFGISQYFWNRRINKFHLTLTVTPEFTRLIIKKLEAKRFILKVLTFCASIIAFAGLPEAFAQYKTERDATIPLEHFYIQREKNGAFRALLSKLHIGLSTGYGRTSFRHKLDGFGILQNPGEQPKIYNSGTLSAGYSNWINTVNASTNTPATGYFAVDSDSAKIGFRSKSFSIPLKATLHVEFDRYRIGGGYSIEYTHIGSFRPLTFENNIGNYSLGKSNIFLKHYFGMIGASVYRYYEYLLVVDLNIGGYSLGKSFNKSLMKRGVYVNLGVTLEREMSEYFKVFVRPSYEVKGYKLSIPETSQSISHRLNAFYINIGATYRLPDLRRCFIKDCHIQIHHAHGNREYRSRRHPIYKKQNPHYGENYPVLIKYKGKNKRKLNPY
jgi:hypothetical protein